MPAREYEILYILKPDLDDEGVAAATKAVDELLEQFGATVHKTDVWGRRKLAYEVKHLREGYYVLTDFQFDTDKIPELEAQLRISETVFRYLVTRKPEKIRSTRARRKAAAAAAEAAAQQEAATEEAVADEAVADDEPVETKAEGVEDSATVAEAPSEDAAETEAGEPVGAAEAE